ncbi:MAG: adenylate/guanylate cyclase domain-containing protein [Nitrospinae bacterium]|nr:adenylate/guanylate cyclase domain-containing protein [Nitrospinota bacterium]
MMKPMQKPWLFKLSEAKVGIAMMALVFAIFFADVPLLNQLSYKTFDLNFKARGPLAGKRDVVVVAIDQKSQEKLGRWPWTRSVMAELINRLSQFGPKAVGLDIVFSYPEQRPDRLLADQLLATTPQHSPAYKVLMRAKLEADTDGRLMKAMRDAGNVASGYFLFTRPEEVETLALDTDADYRNIKRSRFPAIKYPASGKKEFELIKAVGVMPNIKPVTDASAYTGYFNMIPDDDGIMRRMTAAADFNGKYFPALSFQLLRLWYGDANPKIEFEEYGTKGFHIGGTFVPSNEHGQVALNYYGTESAFPTISVADVLDGGLPDERLAELLAGKVVIVGATATGIYDLRNTPFGTVPGVYIHATFIQNVIDGLTLNRADWFFGFEAVSILLLGVALTLAMRRLKVLGGALVAVALIAAYVLFQRYLFIYRYTLLDILYPVMAIVMVYGGLAFYKYFVEASEKKYVKKAFEFYLSPQVIGKLMEDPGKLKLGGETKTLTACFSDVRDFSTLSEKLSPHELVVLLNEYLTEMTDIIMANTGTLDKYIGDAIVSFFGAPLEYDDHATRACTAVLRCRARLAELKEKWKAEGRPVVDARFGVNTGSMLVGNMGSNQRFDYTIMGDEVNLAARLEGINKQYGTAIIVSESTCLALNGRFEVRELDVIRVVGRKTPVKIFELLDFAGKLKPEEAQWVTAYNEAYALYRAWKFAEAAAAFEAVYKMNKEDVASWRFTTRCRSFITNPPDKDWDGVFTHTSK